MSFAKHKEYIEEADTVVLYLSPTSMHAIDVHPEIKNKKGALVEYVFQTSFGALKVKSLIGQKYGSRVIMLNSPQKCMPKANLNYRLNYRGDGPMCCNRIPNSGQKRCHIERKLSTRPTSV